MFTPNKPSLLCEINIELISSMVSLYLDEKVMADDEFTCDLFRFLQLLCEGHNNGA